MDELEKFYNRTLRFLSYRPRSEKEIRDFLKRKRVQSSIIEKILKKLKEQNLVNDEEFTKFWIEQRTTFRPKGLRLIRLELRQKGISEEIIEKIIHNSEFRVQNEEELARKVTEKKVEKYKHLSKEEFYQKMMAFLARRGFDFETIKKVIDEMWKKRYNEK